MNTLNLIGLAVALILVASLGWKPIRPKWLGWVVILVAVILALRPLGALLLWSADWLHIPA